MIVNIIPAVWDIESIQREIDYCGGYRFLIAQKYVWSKQGLSIGCENATEIRFPGIFIFRSNVQG